MMKFGGERVGAGKKFMAPINLAKRNNQSISQSIFAYSYFAFKK
jgi:hypothetical protein